MQGYITFKMIRTNLIFFLRELNLVYYNELMMMVMLKVLDHDHDTKE
jgi:hypothetical protein